MNLQPLLVKLTVTLKNPKLTVTNFLTVKVKVKLG